MAGWFLIGRNIEDHWIWKDREPFDKRSAWIDLLMLANFVDFKTVYKGEVVTRRRGDVNTSIRHLAQRWKWDKRKVNRFLMALESDNMVHVSSTTDGTTITIENYSKWQDVRTTDSTTNGTTDSTTNGTTSAPHDKEDKKKTKEDKKKERVIQARNLIPPTYEMVSEYIYENNYNVDADAFIDYYESKGWMIGRNKMKDWQAAIRNWSRKEKPKQNTNPFTEMLRTGEY